MSTSPLSLFEEILVWRLKSLLFQRFTIKSGSNMGFTAFLWFLWSMQFKSTKENMQVCAQVKWNWAAIYATQNCCFSAVQSSLLRALKILADGRKFSNVYWSRSWQEICTHSGFRLQIFVCLSRMTGFLTYTALRKTMEGKLGGCGQRGLIKGYLVMCLSHRTVQRYPHQNRWVWPRKTSQLYLYSPQTNSIQRNTFCLLLLG